MSKKLTMTFDNGPDPETTPGVLDVLAERGIKATFFVCGNGNTRHPAMKAGADESTAILERIQSEGHWIGNHSLTHAVELGTSRDPKLVEREIGRNEEIMGRFNEHHLFRPYMGGGILGPRVFSPESIEYLCAHKYTTVLFNCVPRDWEIPETWPDEAFRQMAEQDWTLLIVHDVSRFGGMPKLAEFLDRAIEMGYEFTQEFPADCTPIVKGEIVGSLDGLVCGDMPEEPSASAAAAAATLEITV